MRDKVQRTTAKLRQEMFIKYGDEEHHKHNKLHSRPYRMHWRTHPVQIMTETDKNALSNKPTGQLRKLNLQKTRKRLDKGCYH